MDKYTKLHALLEAQETFPTQYTHKFIGRNSPAFAAGMQTLEERFPTLTLETARATRSESYLAVTYTLEADSAEAIIEVLEATTAIPDLHMIL